MLLTKFPVKWPFGPGEEEKNRFQDGGQHGWHLGFWIRRISDQNDFMYPMFPTKFQVDWPFGLDLQITLMLPTKIQVNWCFGSGEEVKIRFSRWQPSWLSYQSDF